MLQKKAPKPVRRIRPAPHTPRKYAMRPLKQCRKLVVKSLAQLEDLLSSVGNPKGLTAKQQRTKELLLGSRHTAIEMLTTLTNLMIRIEEAEKPGNSIVAATYDATARKEDEQIIQRYLKEHTVSL